MAIVYDAQLNPSKRQVLDDWLPRQSWFPADDTDDVEVVAAFRFDDPDGQVGLQTHIVRLPDGRVFQVPMSYRPAPLPTDQDALMSEMEHSVLGRRYIYDATLDPVYVAELTRVIRDGDTGVVEYLHQASGEESGEPTALPSSMTVRGVVSGAAIEAAERPEVLRQLAPAEGEPSDGQGWLVGDWGDGPHLLAIIRR